MPLIPPLSPPPTDWNASECFRCGHNPTFHRSKRGCKVRLGWLQLGRRCPCQSYVPPGNSPEAVDQDSNLRPTA
jgi:hypothetical protein